ncbi:hypothetical protein LXA43DRAFT_1100720 [Ganoderma leucocontextum]|nr:hypothetical protein LXA43DRAFT_1100720 [Ganoderma leucocontextum]
MSFFTSLALASPSSLDRFDNGCGRLDLPLECEDYFRLFGNPKIFTNVVTTSDDGQQHIQLEPFLVKLILEWGYSLAEKISAASYGGMLPNGYVDPLILCTGSLEELGVPPPPLFQLFLQFQDHGFPLSQPLTEVDFVHWMQVVWENAYDTREWIKGAKCRAVDFGNTIGWNFRPAKQEEHSPRSVASHPSLCASSPRTGLVPHPVVGTAAQNALISYLPNSRQSACPLPENPCCVVIPHPIYSLGAHNALIPYDATSINSSDSEARTRNGLSIERPRAPSPWSAYGSNIEYPDSPAPSYVDLKYPNYSRIAFPAPSQATSESDSESYDGDASDSSETLSDYDEPMGHFTVYESESDSELDWEEVAIKGDVSNDLAEFQAAFEDALYEEEGTSSNPIDLTDY